MNLKIRCFIKQGILTSSIISLLVLGAFIFPIVSTSQAIYELDKTTRFDKMGVKEGLSTEYTTCIHQDKYGFIWIGTQRGLNLYNGYEVIVFNADLKNRQALLNDRIRNIYEEPDGTMWFCTNIGISKYNRANQTFSNFLPDTFDIINPNNIIQKIVADSGYLWVDTQAKLFRFNKETKQFSDFRKDIMNQSGEVEHVCSEYIFMDKSKVLWVCSSDSQSNFALSRFNRETETFIHFQNDASIPESFSGKLVRSMIEARDGTIWIATNGGLLEVLDKEKGNFKRHIHDVSDTNSIIHNNLHKVFEASDGSIWLGGAFGFSSFNKETGQFINYRLPDRTDIPSWVNIINDIVEDENGVLWLEANYGFFRFETSTKKMEHYINDHENENSLSDNAVLQIIIDQADQLWLVTGNYGVNKINPFSNTFRKIQKKTHIKNSLTNNYISRFIVDSKENLWIGCYGEGGLNKAKMNKQKVFNDFEQFTYEPDDPNSILPYSITSVYKDHDQILWFGTLNGLNKYNHTTNNFTRYSYNPEDGTTIGNNAVEVIFEDSHGTFWVGTRNGLNIMNKETGKFIRILHDENDSSSISSTDLRVIFEDTYGELWFGGTYLEKLNRNDTSFIHYTANEYSSVLNLSEIWDIEEDDSKNLWLATLREGLIKMNRENMTFDAFNVEKGMPSNYTHAIEIDNNKDIWVASNRGLSRIKHESHEIKNFDLADGLINLELIDRSLYKDKDGWLYFGGRNGFNIFHPDSIKENKRIPPIYITKIKIGGEQKYFEKPLFEMTEVALTYNENDISFDFVALDYINPQRNQYTYMLEGYDKEWYDVGNRRSAYYTNLGAGTYTFRVKGSNNDGYWNEEGASLAIVIYPPFWKTWWAYGIYLLLFLGILYLLRRNELRKINLRQELELKDVHAESLATLDKEKNKFFSNISHEFRTPLTLILGPLERIITAKKKGKERDELSLIRRNARRLQTLINQLLSLSKLESGKMALKARPENIVKLTRLFLQSFHSLAEDKGIKMEFVSDLDEHIVYMDTLKYEKVVNNLLSNALKFTERGAKIRVSIAPPP